MTYLPGCYSKRHRSLSSGLDSSRDVWLCKYRTRGDFSMWYIKTVLRLGVSVMMRDIINTLLPKYRYFFLSLPVFSWHYLFGVCDIPLCWRHQWILVFIFRSLSVQLSILGTLQVLDHLEEVWGFSWFWIFWGNFRDIGCSRNVCREATSGRLSFKGSKGKFQKGAWFLYFRLLQDPSFTFPEQESLVEFQFDCRLAC